MKDSFRPYYFENRKKSSQYHKKKSEFSSYVDASFKGGVIDRPLLDAVPDSVSQYANCREPISSPISKE